VKNASTSARSLRIMLAAAGVAASLVIGGVAQASGQSPPAPSQGGAKVVAMQDTPPCASSSSPNALHDPSKVSQSVHAVKLSWNPSIPRSNAQPDAIKGYYVYRNLTSNKYNDSNRMNSVPLVATSCVDTAVSYPLKYFYVVRAVAVSGMKSDPSNEVKAAIPPR
jgi:hypothetical protein